MKPERFRQNFRIVPFSEEKRLLPVSSSMKNVIRDAFAVLDFSVYDRGSARSDWFSNDWRYLNRESLGTFMLRDLVLGREHSVNVLAKDPTDKHNWHRHPSFQSLNYHHPNYRTPSICVGGAGSLLFSLRAAHSSQVGILSRLEW